MCTRDLNWILVSPFPNGYGTGTNGTYGGSKRRGLGRTAVYDKMGGSNVPMNFVTDAT